MSEKEPMSYREKVEAKRNEMVNTMLDFIQNNSAEWERGWYKSASEIPMNGSTGKPYRGINLLYLMMVSAKMGYTDNRWVTFNQAHELGAHVKRGEKAREISYWSQYDKLTKKPFDEKTVEGMTQEEKMKYFEENVRLVLKFYQVFNAEQCDNFPERKKEELTPEMAAEERARQNALIEQVIKNSAAPISYGGSKAYYSPSLDEIHLPKIEDFKSMQDYYATALHEIAHSTGHESRLNRDLKGIFGTEDYAKEELRAELASVFMQTELGITIDGHHFENHGAYLTSWLKAVREDTKEFFAAARDAEKISDYVAEHYLQAERAEESAQEKNHSNESEAMPVFERNVSFADQVDRVLSGADTTNSHLEVLPTTPQILQDVGLPNLPILMTAKHLKSIMQEEGDGEENYHGLEAETVKQLPGLLSEPVMIMDSLTRDDSIVVVTESIDKENRPVIGAIKLNGFGRRDNRVIDANILTSAYGKDNFQAFIERNIEKGNVLYYNKEKSQALSVNPGVQFPDVMASLDSDIIIRKSRAFVKPSAEKISENSSNDAQGLNENIKEWYSKAYPNDEAGQSIHPKATFKDLWEEVNRPNPISVYGMLGEDSVIRERAFLHLSELTNTSYKDIYSAFTGETAAQRLANARAAARRLAAETGEPHVTVEWTEKSGGFPNIEQYDVMSLSEADKKLKQLDAESDRERGYYKTKLHIDFVFEGKPDCYENCRFDIGIEGGGLVHHIDEFLKNDTFLEPQARAEAEAALEYFKRHMEVSDYAALSQEDQKSVGEYVDQARHVLNTTSPFSDYKDNMPLTPEEIKAHDAEIPLHDDIEAEELLQSPLYGVVYNWKGLKEENTVYTAAQLSAEDPDFNPELDVQDGAFAANKTYFVYKLTGATSEETAENVRAFMTGNMNDTFDGAEMPEGWYWETRTENLFTGGANPTTEKLIQYLGLKNNDLRMQEDDAEKISESAEDAPQKPNFEANVPKNGREWLNLDIPAELLGAEGESKNRMIKLPQGEYSHFVLFVPKAWLKPGEKEGSMKLSVDANSEYTIRNDGREVKLSGSELRAAFEGKEVGKSAQRTAPSRRSVEAMDRLTANVPEEMKALPNWCVFHTKWNAEKGKKDKTIVSPVDGKWAKSNDPSKWTDFETAKQYALEHGAEGLAFALDAANGISCIDLDKCIDKDGKLTETAQKLTSEISETYTETSASGNGIHIFLKDDILVGGKIKNRTETADGEIEVYDSGRFISMTGNVRTNVHTLGKTPQTTKAWLRRTLGERAPQQTFTPNKSVEGSDQEIIDRIRKSKKGPEFDALMAGENLANDHSRSDYRLLNMLAFFTDGNQEQMARIFRTSGLYRPEKGEPYLQRSVAAACKGLTTRIGQGQGGAFRGPSKGPSNGKGH
ncbi:MAG: ssDNA-binding domain-containing protein [Clostridia bacterium]|nr:ssDNA-binding domain-containing protein [Clostridia bacterium]